MGDVVLKTSKGDITIALEWEKAPKHAKRIVELSQQGFFDGVIFHRVIPGFVAQTGDPTGTGTGSSNLPNLDAEISDIKFVRGVLGMARSSALDSANSQFFITFEDAPWLNDQYTVIGTVTEGMEIVDKLETGEPPENPDKIVSVSVIEKT